MLKTKLWSAYFRRCGYAVMETAAKSGAGVKEFVPAVRALLSEKLQRYAEKGQAGRTIRVMVVGIPNVGKSTFINRVAGKIRAKAENRPGVTRPISGSMWAAAWNFGYTGDFVAQV